MSHFRFFTRLLRADPYLKRIVQGNRKGDVIILKINPHKELYVIVENLSVHKHKGVKKRREKNKILLHSCSCLLAELDTLMNAEKYKEWVEKEEEH